LLVSSITVAVNISPPETREAANSTTIGSKRIMAGDFTAAAKDTRSDRPASHLKSM
jgi:hypothetical protein